MICDKCKLQKYINKNWTLFRKNLLHINQKKTKLINYSNLENTIKKQIHHLNCVYISFHSIFFCRVISL